LLTNEVIENVSKYLPIEIACIPINEDNLQKRNNGIIGNMGIRDALYFADLLKVKHFLPLHWDMYNCNRVYINEFLEICNNLKTNLKINFNNYN
jgi:L-ascorbate metabolism protein UlaG (beta-lactamase superfamily)